ncbi:Na+/H+ antiporter subunit G [Acinetobacter indicus]|uniref:Na+/H+ antiporter subunit G n=1 Tax=Acinetobacter TaxID=469 RepID=UPI00143FCB25|nr:MULTISPECIES: Na+/H+ antiporter subunit G [Acinetobacter]MCP0917438.1 Na+/H+ antiporter subunit G [Acinetobacter indicus]MCP0920551.1 Na+/H+ antiporter subunit G [Acinetobacter indicus]MCP0923218.1 Na+/H+ antiporter subunit G [Acinetobacter indicus]QIZ60755.1 Na+/H+ antiporter subunit G [Acinetobacter indicus]QSQ92514.1 Na+/H+ antiporter subunit G [Acinetobacter indicus]
MQLMMEILVSIFLLIGTFFMLVGGIGMIRLPDLFMRLHAPTKSSTLGLGSFLIAAIIYSAYLGRFGFAEVLITLFAFITAPVSANLMAQAALHLRLRSMSGEVPETLERPLPWQRSRHRAFTDREPLGRIKPSKDE